MPLCGCRTRLVFVNRFCTFIVALLFLPLSTAGARAGSEEIPDITGKYHFLSPQDTLALLDEDGAIKGWVDVLQEEGESDAVLSYQVTQGSRKGHNVEFKTSKIHQKYYRFAGTVQRGAGRKEGDADYLRLIGTLETVSVNGVTGTEAAQRKPVVFKSLGKSEN